MIRIKFIRWDNVVAMKVLEMNEAFRFFHHDILNKKLEKSKYFSEIRILTDCRPAIIIDKEECVDYFKIRLFLRGKNRDYDNNLSYFEFDSSEIAKEFIEVVQIAIKEINEKEKTFQDIENIEI